MKPFVYKCRKHVLVIDSSDSPFRTDDYKELQSLVFLDGEEGEYKVIFKRPRALHKASWMAKLVYSPKICLSEQQIADLPRSTIIAAGGESERDLVNIVTLVYTSWWMECSLITDAPWNDLKLLHLFLLYKLLKADMSTVAVCFDETLVVFNSGNGTSCTVEQERFGH